MTKSKVHASVLLSLVLSSTFGCSESPPADRSGMHDAAADDAAADDAGADDAAADDATAADATAAVDAGSIPITPAVPLDVLVPPNVESYGIDADYVGQTITGDDGVVRTERLVDFEGTSSVVYLRRTVLGDPELFGGHRAEFSWYRAAPFMRPGEDHWFAFALRPLEWHDDDDDGADRQIFFQIHQINDADDTADGPTFEMSTNGLDNSLEMGKVTGTTSVEVGSSIYSGGQDSRPPTGEWTRFIVHLRLGYDASFAPVIQVWRNETSIYDVSGDAALIGAPNAEPDYPKIGIYKWRELDYDTPDRRSGYWSELHHGEGADLYDRAVAALAAFR